MKEKTSNIQTLNKLGFRLILGLALQYILGITTTLFIEFPQNASDEQQWNFAWKHVPVSLHIILGIMLLFGSIGLLARAIKLKSKQWIIASSIGLIVTLATIICGAIFVSTQSDLLSYFMALGFIIVLTSYAWSIYSSSKLTE